MDTPPQNTQQSKQDGSASARSFDMLRKRKEQDIAQIINERVDRQDNLVSRKRGINIFFALFVGLLLLILVGYFFVVPNLVFNLPSWAAGARSTQQTYKRVVRIFVDHFPATPYTQSAEIAEIARGASFTIVSSSDIARETGVQGVVRMKLNDPSLFITNPDVDIGFKAVYPSTQASSTQKFLIFSTWPAAFDSIIPASIALNQWLSYESDDYRAPTGISQALSLTDSTNAEWQRELAAFVWRHAMNTAVLSANPSFAMRKDVSGKNIVDIHFALNPRRLGTFASSLKADPEYEKNFSDFFEGRFEDWPPLIDLVSSTQKLSGTMSVRIADRVVSEFTVNFDLYHGDVGRLRGTVASSIAALSDPLQIEVPETRVDLKELVALGALLESAPGPRTSDSDGDGLSDEDEVLYGSNPQKQDSDNDGFMDGAEVGAGYNPAGSGTLKLP